ncbi:MAG: cytochrome c [Pirellulaceae bacterium]
MIPRRVWTSLIILAVAACAAAFPAMAWVRSRQGHTGDVYPSEIRRLATRKASADPLADARDRGGRVYMHYCRICHGDHGEADGFNASRLDPPPRNFTDTAFWDRTSDERVLSAIREGGPSNGKSVLMPAWGNMLTDQQANDVMIFIQSLKGRVEPPEP